MNETTASRTGHPPALRDLTAELAALPGLSTAELHDRWVEAFGEKPRSRNRQWLTKRLAWRLQEQAEGGLTDRALRKVNELAAKAPVRHRPPKGWEAPAPEPTTSRDDRLPPSGTVLRREHGGEPHEVRVLDDGGFDYRGERYGSLSAIATAITGTRWNGLVWFGLKRRGQR
jgi:hypothetical protein